jgi:hypothetical protein
MEDIHSMKDGGASRRSVNLTMRRCVIEREDTSITEYDIHLSNSLRVGDFGERRTEYQVDNSTKVLCLWLTMTGYALR